jgi:hypothetical protein
LVVVAAVVGFMDFRVVVEEEDNEGVLISLISMVVDLILDEWYVLLFVVFLFSILFVFYNFVVDMAYIFTQSATLFLL